MYYYLYKITNKKNKRVYVGVHKTENLLDGYMGSGKLIKAAVAKYGLSCFDKEILMFCESYEKLLEVERNVVNSIFVHKTSSYNLRIGGNGGFDYINNNNVSKFKGRKHTQETKKKIGEKLSVIFSQGIYKKYFTYRMLGNNYNPNIKCKGFVHLAYGKPKSPQHKLKISNAIKSVHAKGVCLSHNIYKKGALHPAFGSVWVCNSNLGLTEKIKSCFLDSYLSLGWRCGRIFAPRKTKRDEGIEPS